ncbi:MAG: SDR family oxidoreductase [Aestuariivita sp.]|nr:SDR family oxidoreductase [Aestuariivita sp.]MCY4203791.1 SDR family oxidoreductase [Aestuariivita sp.]
MSQHCVVTGGASGMGASTARLAAKNGFSVSILSLERDRAAGEVLIKEISDIGGKASFFPVDVALESEVVLAYDAAVREFGIPTAAVHAAGLFVSGTILDMDVEATAHMIAVNLTGLMICCREAARHMSTDRGGTGGSIVNITSMAATIGGRPGACAYAATKGAVDVFTKGFAKEVARQGIRVNTIRPGAIASPMTAALELNPELKKSVEASIPMGRLGTCDEIADIAVWLSSESASLVTGALVDASGGGFNVAGSI